MLLWQPGGSPVWQGGRDCTSSHLNTTTVGRAGYTKRTPLSSSPPRSTPWGSVIPSALDASIRERLHVFAKSKGHSWAYSGTSDIRRHERWQRAPVPYDSPGHQQPLFPAARAVAPALRSGHLTTPASPYARHPRTRCIRGACCLAVNWATAGADCKVCKDRRTPRHLTYLPILCTLQSSFTIFPARHPWHYHAPVYDGEDALQSCFSVGHVGEAQPRLGKAHRCHQHTQVGLGRNEVGCTYELYSDNTSTCYNLYHIVVHGTRPTAAISTPR